MVIRRGGPHVLAALHCKVSEAHLVRGQGGGVAIVCDAHEDRCEVALLMGAGGEGGGTKADEGL